MAQAESRTSSPAMTVRGSASDASARRGDGQVCYAALDLGTNNCRLLIAAPAGARGEGGFRVVEAFSRIVRLGEGLSRTGLLDETAMDRAVAALQICAEKVRRRRAERFVAVATQACRSAANGPAFVERVARETGIRLSIITPREEAELALAGCRDLIDPTADAALVVDVGGGSTELSWVDLRKPRAEDAMPEDAMPVEAWVSLPLGVVSLAERFPETDPADAAWFRRMVDHVRGELSAFPGADALRPLFGEGRAHLVGTSGAITSLAGLHLGLRRYDRTRVDGLWMTADDCVAAADRLLSQDRRERAREPCIGPDRADLVLAGAAILQAIQELWPCERVRVADRGLREGLLLRLFAERSESGRRRRRRSGGFGGKPA